MFLIVSKGVASQSNFTFKGKYFEVLEGGFGVPLSGLDLPEITLRGISDSDRAMSGKGADVHELDLGTDDLDGKIVSVGYPGPFAPDAELKPAVYDFDNNLLLGDAKSSGGGARYLPVFKAHDDITTVSHIHTVYLGAWAQSHRTLPLRYVPAERWTRVKEIPIYIDRRQGEANFINKRLSEDNGHFAILEANGGSTVWGRKGLLALANTALILEEGARFQLLAETLGGSKLFGPGVLEQQWKMSGLWQDSDAVAVAAE